MNTFAQALIGKATTLEKQNYVGEPRENTLKMEYLYKYLGQQPNQPETTLADGKMRIYVGKTFENMCKIE